MEFLNFVGDWFKDNPLVGTVLLLTLIDIVTGITRAFILKNVSSLLSTRGMIKKTAFVYSIVLAYILQPYAPEPVDLRVLVPTFFIWVEAVSIVENLRGMGVPLPNVLTKFIEDRFKTEPTDSVTALVDPNINPKE